MPVIGLTTSRGNKETGYPSVYLLRAYLAAILAAGGTPVLIPSELPEDGRRELFARLDGVLFTGGGDIARERFHGEPHPRVSDVDEQRDELEFSLLAMAVQSGKPFLGICRGFQAVNVALGGTLFTHIADQKPGALKHDYYPDWPRDHLAHAVRLEAGTRLAEILGADELPVNSLHHQGAKDLAPDLRPAAFAPDGLVEGLELPAHPFGLAVQWHPEWLTAHEPARRLFRAFVEACDRG